METRKLRLFRQKYHISLLELARACGLSSQRISEIELNRRRLSDDTVKRLREGMEQVISRREALIRELRNDYVLYGDTILDQVEETDHEL